jgi:outer membrane protein assembly factor BamB
VDPVERRTVLGTLGAGALAAASGGAGLRHLTPVVRDHEHHRDAPVGDVEGPWPTHAAGFDRQSALDLPIPRENATIREVTTIGRFVESQPVVVGDRAYIGVDRRRPESDPEGEPFSGLVAIDLEANLPQAAILWSVDAGEPTSSYSPTVRGRVVYSRARDGLQAVDARDGSRYWWNQAGGGTPAVDGDVCFTFDTDGAVALDAVTGERRWRSDDTIAVGQGLATTDDAVLVACGSAGEGALYCFERDDGTTRWRYDGVGESYATAVVDGERAYAAGTDGLVYAVSLETGVEVWRYNVGGPSYAQPAVADSVYVTSTDDARVAAVESESGRARWEATIGTGGMSPPAVTAEHLLFTTSTDEGRRLVALRRGNGTERWRMEVPAPGLRAVQPVVGDGTAYVVAEAADRNEGSLHVLE